MGGLDPKENVGAAEPEPKVPRVDACSAAGFCSSSSLSVLFSLSSLSSLASAAFAVVCWRGANGDGAVEDDVANAAPEPKELETFPDDDKAPKPPDAAPAPKTLPLGGEPKEGPFDCNVEEAAGVPPSDDVVPKLEPNVVDAFPDVESAAKPPESSFFDPKREPPAGAPNVGPLDLSAGVAIDAPPSGEGDPKLKGPGEANDGFPCSVVV